ncbi:MAG: RdgB/HAM1 family non-canonical purine NTP pyrophosphatase [Rhodobiaceae bacterium]|nr:RdgB/HAM1 family non-canonical purine NTP pyrophosphatase [Rhodobiaceae bacterium]MCC0049247.1 RdgB/HAM1 family non-canonical purine NTP pyrophosphatase [Rhodobiaceae bacterium]
MRAVPGKIVVASHNEGKVREIRDLLGPLGCEIVSAAELDLPEPEENGETFEENAKIKALAAATASGIPSLSDDSGLCVDALDGKPGIHSARWAGPEKDFALAMRNVEEAMQAAGATDDDKRGARFVAVLCLAWPDGHTELFRGEIEGVMVWPPRGTKGFGYDPVFLPEGHARTFGEMDAAEKHGWKRGEAHALSHRARAFKLMVETGIGDD